MRRTPARSGSTGERIDDLPDRKRDELRNRAFGFIFQFYHLLPELTARRERDDAADDPARPAVVLGPSAPGPPRGRALLERVGLGHRLTHLPSELSGGEMQRTAIARALAGDPTVLLADEPTGNLDAGSGHGVLELLRDLNRERGLTMIMVTHDPLIAQQADRVVRLAEGRIEEWSPALA